MKQKVWFKYCSAAAVAMLAVGLLSGCGNQAETEEQYKIGIVQLTSHEAAIRAIRVVQALADHGLGRRGIGYFCTAQRAK